MTFNNRTSNVLMPQCYQVTAVGTGQFADAAFRRLGVSPTRRFADAALRRTAPHSVSPTAFRRRRFADGVSPHDVSPTRRFAARRFADAAPNGVSLTAFRRRCFAARRFADVSRNRNRTNNENGCLCIRLHETINLHLLNHKNCGK